MTTLADMTPEQREQCLGMWCEAGEHLWVLRAVYETTVGLRAKIIDPAADRMANYTSADHVTPRGDLPRAWQPDGTPVNGHWEYESDRIIGHGGRTVRTLTSRRFVGEWEGEWEEA